MFCRNNKKRPTAQWLGNRVASIYNDAEKDYRNDSGNGESNARVRLPGHFTLTDRGRGGEAAPQRGIIRDEKTVS